MNRSNTLKETCHNAIVPTSRIKVTLQLNTSQKMWQSYRLVDIHIVARDTINARPGFLFGFPP